MKNGKTSMGSRALLLWWFMRRLSTRGTDHQSLLDHMGGWGEFDVSWWIERRGWHLWGTIVNCRVWSTFSCFPLSPHRSLRSFPIITQWLFPIITQCMSSMKLVIRLHFISWKKDSKRCCHTTRPESIHTNYESKRGSALAFIFGVNWPMQWM